MDKIRAMLAKASGASEEELDEAVLEIDAMLNENRDIIQKDIDLKPIIRTPEEKFGKIYNSFYGVG